MTTPTVSIHAFSPEAADRHVPDLTDVLIDCVAGGASVGFMAPLSRETAEAFWRGVAAAVSGGDRILLGAVDDVSRQLVGTVQILLRQPENQPHRANIAKMLVLRAERRRGIGDRLMRAAEDAARAAGKTLLVLDTVTDSDAARLYTRLGWVRVGDIPGYALWPDGRPCATTYYYRSLA